MSDLLFLPLSIDPHKSTMMPCCTKLLCNGCCYAALENRVDVRCPFCREPPAKSKTEAYQKKMMERVKANDPVATCEMGKKRYLEGDYDSALQYYEKRQLSWGV